MTRTIPIVRVALAVALGAGVFLRLYHYVANRALWLDEAMLSLTLITGSVSELLQPSGQDQVPPLGFGLAERAAIALLGPHEPALRLIPLLAGLGALLLYPWMAAAFADPGSGGANRPRRIGSLAPDASAAVLVATLLFAVADQPVYFASEAKPYAVDLLATVVLLLVGHRLLRPQVGMRTLALFAVLAAFAVFMSHPSVFIVPGVGIAGLVVAAGSRRWRPVANIVAALLPAVLVFGTLYWVSLRGSTANPWLSGYWQHGFMPLPPWRDWGWFVPVGQAFLRNPVGAPGPVTALLLMAGTVGVARRRRLDALLLTLPFVFALAASALRAYPFAERLTMFLTPIVYLLLAEGIRWLASLVPVPSLRRALWAAGALLLTVQVATPTIQRVAAPYSGREDFRPVLARMESAMQSGDTVYCYRFTCSVFQYYALVTPLPDVSLERGQYHGAMAPERFDELAELDGRGRVWVLVGRSYPGDDERILTYMDSIGVRRDAVVAHDMSVVLYDTHAGVRPKPRMDTDGH